MEDHTDFTEVEAKKKQGKHVRILDDSFSDQGVQKGMHGRVVAATPHGSVKVVVEKEVWTVGARFSPGNILVEYIGKEQYEKSLQEGDLK